MNRRALLSTVAVLPLAACAGTVDKFTAVIDKVPAIAENAKTIADALTRIRPSIEQIVGVSEIVLAKVRTAVQMVKDAATALQNMASGNTSSLAIKIADGVTILTSAVTGFKLPLWASTVIQAAVAALPAIGINIPMAGHGGGLNPRQALAILKAA